MINIFQAAHEDLHRVQLIIQKNCKIKVDFISDFILNNLNYLDHNLHPSLVIFSNRVFGPVTDRTIALAAVVQYIYLASRVHLEVVESNSEQQDAPEKFQYPVLVGDYLYAKAFTILYDADMLHYQKQLAKVVCSINRGGILNEVNKNVEITEMKRYSDIVRKETADLLACSAYLGADVAGADNGAKRQLYHFGLNFGMAYGLQTRGVALEQFAPYLAKAEAALCQLPQNSQTVSLKGLLTLFDQEKPMRRMVI